MAEPKRQRAICLEFECLYDRYAREKLAQVYRILVPTGNDAIQTTAEDLSFEKNAAIYARVSSDRQREQNTIASQTALLLEYAKAHDCVVPREWIFEDDGYSGSVLARPGLERLRDLVAEGLIKTVLVYAPDRLSRKYAYQVLLLEEFGRCGADQATQ
jgi:predicted site-specific integrase-resolvase